jgi:dihydrofolate reductase
MRTVNKFNFISLDGFYKDSSGGIGWHQHGGDDEAAFSAQNANSGAVLLFGRKTYEMMQGFWTSDTAFQIFPEVAAGMNAAQKIVVSHTLHHAAWQNTMVVNGDLCEIVRRMKAEQGTPITILGSGTIVAQLAAAQLIDTYQFLVVPTVLGSGTTLFEGVTAPINLTLTGTRTFKSGKVLLVYKQD